MVIPILGCLPSTAKMARARQSHQATSGDNCNSDGFGCRILPQLLPQARCSSLTSPASPWPPPCSPSLQGLFYALHGTAFCFKCFPVSPFQFLSFCGASCRCPCANCMFPVSRSVSVCPDPLLNIHFHIKMLQKQQKITSVSSCYQVAGQLRSRRHYSRREAI